MLEFIAANPWVIPASFAGIIFLGTITMIMRYYRKVNQGHALIINKMKGDPRVTFTGGMVSNFQSSEAMDSIAGRANS